MKAVLQPVRPRLWLRQFAARLANVGGRGLWALILLGGWSGGHAQPAVLGQASEFSSDEYFQPPNEQRVKMRLSGSAASPLPGGRLDITNLKIQTFNLGGATEAVVYAPECVYAPYDGLASSAGHLRLEVANGKIVITGEGFLWRQTEDSLTISNNVHTIIQMKALPARLP